MSGEQSGEPGPTRPPLGVLVRGAALSALLRVRGPVAMAVPLLRSMTARLGYESSGAAAALAPLVPGGIRSTLDERYSDNSRFALLDAFRREDEAAPAPVIVWLHGGGWLGGTKNDLREYLSILAARGFVTVGVDYTWAPTLRYPGQLGEVADAIRHVLRNARRLGVDPDRIVLAGDSAGAHIAAQLSLAIRDRRYAARLGVDTSGIDAPRLRAVGLFCGPFTVRPPDLGSSEGRLSDLFLRAYTGVRDYTRDERVMLMSLTEAAGARFAPAFVTAGSVDPMARSSRELADRLAALGVPTSTLFFEPDHEPPLGHEYQLQLERAEARHALDLFVDHVKRNIG